MSGLVALDSAIERLRFRCAGGGGGRAWSTGAADAIAGLHVKQLPCPAGLPQALAQVQHYLGRNSRPVGLADRGDLTERLGLPCPGLMRSKNNKISPRQPICQPIGYRSFQCSWG